MQVPPFLQGDDAQSLMSAEREEETRTFRPVGHLLAFRVSLSPSCDLF